MNGLTKVGRNTYFSPINAILLVILLLTLGACKETLLDEIPKDSLNPDVVLTSKAGFENYLTALHQTARNEMILQDLTHYFDQNIGTDIATTGQEPAVNFRNYATYLIPDNPVSRTYWDWAYANMLNSANTIIVYANRPASKTVWATEAEKNAVIAEARFFRAYTHNLLANLYGGVPIVDTVYTGPKTDFVRNTRKQVYESARADLEFAAKWLPETVVKAREGRIVKAAADHLLSEVYISLGEYDKAVEAASRVIGSGQYKLMADRFGTEKDKPGDVFSDLFKDGNQNRSSGNLESIFVWQFENLTPGGGGSRGNHNLRGWGPFYINLKDPDNKAGMVIVDSLGRGVGWVRPTTFFLYDLWKENATDIRNSPFNIRRTNYYTNSASKYFKMPVEKKKSLEDTMQNLYPTILKVEGKPWTNNNTSGQTAKDVMVYRLAETYLLRAEAYLRKGDVQKAADDLNAVRKRANAKPVNASAVTIDFLLDERARELITEEPRRRTLMRMGKLVERVRKYNMRESTRSSILEKHELFPIPQTAIDANFSKKLEQNPGY